MKKNDEGLQAWRSYKALDLAEEIESKLTDIDNTLECVHYQPDEATDEDVENLKKLQELVDRAARIAATIA